MDLEWSSSDQQVYEIISARPTSNCRMDLLTRQSIQSWDLARIVMAESGLGGRSLFKAAHAGKDARNVTYTQRLGQTPYSCIYDGELKDGSRFRAFECRTSWWVYLNAEKREKGKRIPRAQRSNLSYQVGSLQSLAHQQLYKGTPWHGEQRHRYEGKFIPKHCPSHTEALQHGHVGPSKG